MAWLLDRDGDGTASSVRVWERGPPPTERRRKGLAYLCLGIYCIHVNVPPHEGPFFFTLFVLSSLAVSLYSLATLFQERRVTSPSSLGYLHKSPRKTRPKMKQMVPTVR